MKFQNRVERLEKPIKAMKWNEKRTRRVPSKVAVFTASRTINIRGCLSINTIFIQRTAIKWFLVELSFCIKRLDAFSKLNTDIDYEGGGCRWKWLVLFAKGYALWKEGVKYGKRTENVVLQKKWNCSWNFRSNWNQCVIGLGNFRFNRLKQWRQLIAFTSKNFRDQLNDDFNDRISR